MVPLNACGPSDHDVHMCTDAGLMLAVLAPVWVATRISGYSIGSFPGSEEKSPINGQGSSR